MCLSIRDVFIGANVQAIYKKKLEENYTYTRLPENKLFYNLFSLKKDDHSFIIGSDRTNGTSMFVLSESIPVNSVDKRYITYLEFFLKEKLIPMPEHIKNEFSKADTDFVVLNGASNSAGHMVIIGTVKDDKNPDHMLWTAIVLSPSRLGLNTQRSSGSYFNSSSKNESSISSDLWAVLSGVGTIAGLYSLF
jgi:hypothetical protein